RAREGKPELRELGLVPPRPDPELEAPVRQVIDGDRDLRQESRMPVQVAGHVQADPRALRDPGHGPEESPTIEDRRRRIGAERDKVIEIGRASCRERAGRWAAGVSPGMEV